MRHRYTNHCCLEFVSQVREAGFKDRHYRGYCFREGPAVWVDDREELVQVIRATTMDVAWDSCGREGHIVYPVNGTHDKGVPIDEPEDDEEYEE